ncbi:MAG: TetR/AcrR family transcriptional regulator [Deltaproteobacteria bacterium]|nr:TetR/AcrR family transcriptional regulator [Deltaproteobacteria bacterium]
MSGEGAEHGKKTLRDERCTQLLEAARRVFAQKGYHAATVDDVTRAAGVAKGTFYLYFGEKRAAFYELIRQFFELVTDVGRSVSRDVATKSEYFARVEQAASSLAKLFRENRDLVRLVYRESMGMDDQLEAMVRDFYRRMAAVEADNVRLGIELGLLRDDLNPLLVAYAHIGIVERVLLQSIFDRSFPEISDLVHQLITLSYDGVRRREGEQLAPRERDAVAR